MTKRPKPKSKAKPAARRRRVRVLAAESPYALADVLFEAMGRVRARGGEVQGACAQALATLTLAKLLVRLRNGGSLEWPGDPRVLDVLHELSDELAEQLLVASGDEELAQARRRRGGRPRLRVVRAGDPFRISSWGKRRKAGVPRSLEGERLTGVPGLANEMVDAALRAFADAPRPRDGDVEYLTVLITALAIGKAIVGLWEDGEEIAFFEELADTKSELDYETIVQRASTRRGSPDARPQRQTRSRTKRRRPRSRRPRSVRPKE